MLQDVMLVKIYARLLSLRMYSVLCTYVLCRLYPQAFEKQINFSQHAPLGATGRPLTNIRTVGTSMRQENNKPHSLLIGERMERESIQPYYVLPLRMTASEGYG